MDSSGNEGGKSIDKERELIDAARQLVVSSEETLQGSATDGNEDATCELYWDDICPGYAVGPYHLLEKIGEGGFGIVFVAEQKTPLQRKVALKIIKPGMDTREVIARFEAERQALAMMEHPNIARVFDAGATESGRPYFVMELVRGQAVTDFCDRGNLTIVDRLQLFISICDAVHHAHQKGIIHRDIKPSNVLVATREDQPLPKVIDFGVAKAVHQRLTDKTVHTRYAQVLGTPLYASPEQLSRRDSDVDTRSDIYSLGVLLYELLTGSTPIERSQLQDLDDVELLKSIHDFEPPKPSSRIGLIGESAADVCARRQTELFKLRQCLQGDLDWIVMQALEKERTRRYQSARELADDVRRFLHNEPVTACPPSTLYRIRKYAQRHRVAFTAGILILVALVAGIVTSSSLAFWALRNQERAHKLYVAETEARQSAEASEKRALFAEKQSKRLLYDSFVAQAQANRWSRRAGQRVESLAALREAARVARELNYGDLKIRDLRDEAIACMSLMDIQTRNRFELPQRDWYFAFSPHRRMLQLHRQARKSTDS